MEAMFWQKYLCTGKSRFKDDVFTPKLVIQKSECRKSCIKSPIRVYFRLKIKLKI